jgi:hypothetical protein
MILFTILGVSLTLIISSSEVAELFKPKDVQSFWGRATRCPMCIGAWVGALLSLTRYADHPWWVCALIISLFSYVFDIILYKIQK